MMWFLMVAVVAAAGFYAAWQRERATKAMAQAQAARTSLAETTANYKDRMVRYEGVIADLKSRFVQLEDMIYASNDPAAIRNLFDRLFPPVPEP